MPSNIAALKALIQTQKETTSPAATQMYARGQLKKLHGAIEINAPKPEAALLAFISEYIDSVPDYIQGLSCLAKETGIESYVQPLLTLGCSYFINPPEIIQHHQGLHRLLCSAYLVHRLIEEINDQVMNITGVPLAKMDMSMANIICHSLIGDAIANALDHLVLLTIETSTEGKEILDKNPVKQQMQQRQFSDWGDIMQRWPCFAKDYAIGLQLNR